MREKGKGKGERGRKNRQREVAASGPLSKRGRPRWRLPESARDVGTKKARGWGQSEDKKNFLVGLENETGR